LARQNAKTPRDLPGAMVVVEACMKIIWKCRLAGGLRWWALENPRGYLNQFLGRPAFEFYPFEFGDSYFKKTFLWGWFKAPRKLSLEKIIQNRNPILSFENCCSKDPIIRSQTSPGFARAFFKANP